MSNFIELGQTLWWPGLISGPRIAFSGPAGGWSNATATTMDAANEKHASMGYVYWYGAPAAAKTFSSAGAKIHFRTGSVTFADAGTNVRIGVQDLAASGVALWQPDGTFDVYADVAGNSGTITSSDDNVVKTISMGSGTKAISHGQLIAVVFDMTARAGSDSLTVYGQYGAATTGFPTTASDVGAGWVDATFKPSILLEADDGTLGIFYGTHFQKTGSQYALQASATPDERGLIFQVPFRCKVDCCMFSGGSQDTAADVSFCLYSTPVGTPTELVAISYPGDYGANSANERPGIVAFGAAYELQPNTDYCISVKGTGTADFFIGYYELNSEAHRPVNGLSGMRGGYRSDGSGAFTESTTIFPIVGIGISHIDAGSLLTHPGMGGGARG